MKCKQVYNEGEVTLSGFISHKDLGILLQQALNAHITVVDR